MKISELIPTHNSLRSKSTLEYFRNQIKAGESLYPVKLVKVRYYPSYDYKVYIHDGHHRLVAMYLEGVKELTENDYEIRDVTYEHYKEINFDVGWVTPFDLRTEVRRADFFDFKNEVMSMYNNVNFLTPKPERLYPFIVRYIQNNVDEYSETRKVWKVEGITYD